MEQYGYVSVKDVYRFPEGHRVASVMGFEKSMRIKQFMRNMLNVAMYCDG